MKNITIIIFIIFISLPGLAQEVKKNWFQNHTEVGGYVKYLNIVNFQDADYLTTDNLWHNRLNVRLDFTDNISFRAGMRNRIFYGDMLKSPFFNAEILDKDPGLVDLTFLPVQEKNLLLQSSFDRLFVRMNFAKWEINLGRQRINWGIHTVWNPNDLFNASNYLDFDYEEKPGTDAVRISYETGEMSKLEIAYKPDRDFNTKRDVLAMRYQFNYKDYDVQLILADYYQDINMGLGWAGNIYNWSFKGEASYFLGKDDGSNNSFVTSLGLDYSFKKGINWSFSGLYNSGFTSVAPNQLLTYFNTDTRLDAKNLFPSKFAFFNSFSGNFGPAWQWRLSEIYATENNIVIMIPQLTYNINDTWQVDITGQSFFADIDNMEQHNIVYFRLAWYF